MQKDSEMIADAISDVLDLTRQIDAGIAIVDDLLKRRLAAIDRMYAAADRQVILMDEQQVRRALSGQRSPFLPELVSLAVYEAGDAGATLPFIGSRLRERLGVRVDPAIIEKTLKTLSNEGVVRDRGTRFFAPTSNLLRATGDSAPTIKSLIVEAMELGDRTGIAVAKIRDMIAERHGRTIPVSTLHPIMRQLERAGRVIKDGRKWMLAENADASSGG
ncbi:hypothetical protein [Sphingomonas sp. 2378]|uniref:hypothetical protein n=1 Tax=Sphingomonas sp. 2378 TaxID=1219748 RepID=UPI00311AF13A